MPALAVAALRTPLWLASGWGCRGLPAANPFDVAGQRSVGRSECCQKMDQSKSKRVHRLAIDKPSPALQMLDLVLLACCKLPRCKRVKRGRSLTIEQAHR